jgi:hypothetical protein
MQSGCFCPLALIRLAAGLNLLTFLPGVSSPYTQSRSRKGDIAELWTNIEAVR